MRGDRLGHVPVLALRGLLLPVLVMQALAVRRTVRRLPEPEGPRAGQAGKGPALRLLILGDSSAAGVGAAHQDHALSGRLVRELARDHAVAWRLLAAAGATTGDAIRRVKELAPGCGPFDTVVVALGVNDVTRAVPLPLWLSRQRRLVRILQDRLGAQRIYLSGVPPMGAFPVLPQPLRGVLGQQAARFERHLVTLAPSLPGVTHVPLGFEMQTAAMAEDGFHPGPEIYAIWAGALARRIRMDRQSRP